MEAKKPETFNQDYWLAKSALYWVENQGQIAREAWAVGTYISRGSTTWEPTTTTAIAMSE